MHHNALIPELPQTASCFVISCAVRGQYCSLLNVKLLYIGFDKWYLADVVRFSHWRWKNLKDHAIWDVWVTDMFSIVQLHGTGNPWDIWNLGRSWSKVIQETPSTLQLVSACLSTWCRDLFCDAQVALNDLMWRYLSSFVVQVQACNNSNDSNVIPTGQVQRFGLV